MLEQGLSYIEWVHTQRNLSVETKRQFFVQVVFCCRFKLVILPLEMLAYHMLEFQLKCAAAGIEVYTSVDILTTIDDRSVF